MVDYFRSNLATFDNLIGSFDDSKGLYNLSMQSSTSRGGEDTVSFKEQVTGWPSRKSFLYEGALTLNNIYYSFKDGEIYSHDSQVRNTFYDTFANSSIKVVLNDSPNTIKSFKTISYEGSQSRILQDTRRVGLDDSDPPNVDTTPPFDSMADRAGDSDNLLYNLNASTGWYASSIVSDKQNGFIPEFIEKEGKWFNYIKGDETTLLNLDSKEFNVQGIGSFSTIADSQAPTTVNITIEENND